MQLDTDARDVLVSNPDLVDAVVRTPRRIFLLATKVGQTNAFFFDAQGKQILALDIRVEKDVVDLASLMKAAMPNSSIQVQALNDNVVLTGSVASALESTRAADLAAKFTGDPKKVVNMLGIAGGQQVMLKVRIAEMDRNIAKQFGLDLAGAKIVGGLDTHRCVHRQPVQPGGPGAQRPVRRPGRPGLLLRRPPTTILSAPCSTAATALIQNNVQGLLKALEHVGLVHMLAEPNLTAVSGETAKFLAGGEFPVPVSRDRDGNVTVEFKQFGVGLSFTPVVVAPGRISPAAFQRSQRTDQYRRLHPDGRRQQQRPDHSGLDRAPHPDHGRTALRRQLRGGRPDAAQYQAGDRRLSRREGPAGAGRPVPQPRLCR